MGLLGISKPKDERELSDMVVLSGIMNVLDKIPIIKHIQIKKYKQQKDGMDLRLELKLDVNTESIGKCSKCNKDIKPYHSWRTSYQGKHHLDCKNEI